MATPRLERIVPFIVLTVFLDLVGFGIILPLLPSYVRAMGGSAQTVGILFSSFAAAQLVATPVLGRLSDKHGRRRVILLSLGANAIAMALFSVAAMKHALVFLFASRLLAGATSGNIGACQASIADVSSGSERTRAMGRVGAGISLGMMLGPWLGGQASKWGEAAPPLFAAGLAVLAFIGVFLFLPETNRACLPADERPANAPTPSTADAPKPRPKLTFAALSSNPRIVLVMVLYFLTFLYMTNLQVALALLASERFQWTEKHIGDLFGLFGLVTLIVQGFLVGPIAARLPAVSVVMTGALFAAIGLATIGITPIAPGMIGGLVLLATGLGLTNPLLASLASEYAGESQQGTVLGFAQSSGGLARALGPLLWGAMYKHLGPAAAFFGGACSAILVCAISLHALATQRERVAARPADRNA